MLSISLYATQLYYHVYLLMVYFLHIAFSLYLIPPPLTLFPSSLAASISSRARGTIQAFSALD